MSNKYLVYCNHLFSVMPNSNLANYKLTKSSVDIDKRKNKGKNIFLKKLKLAGMKCRHKPKNKFLQKGSSLDNEVPSHLLPVNFSSF